MELNARYNKKIFLLTSDYRHISIVQIFNTSKDIHTQYEPYIRPSMTEALTNWIIFFFLKVKK